MALVGYVKIDEIQGESQRGEHEEEIDIHGLHWEVKQTSSAAIGSGRTSSRASISGLTVYKWCDAASPYLAHAAMKGTNLNEVTVTIRKDSGDVHLDYLEVKMEKCIISRYEMLDPSFGPDDPEEIREKVTFSCEKVTVKYIVQADDHSAGAEHETEYDIVAAA